jgi:hypothetical protein
MVKIQGSLKFGSSFIAGVEETKILKTHSQIKIKAYANVVGLSHYHAYHASYGFALFFVHRNIEKRFL